MKKPRGPIKRKLEDNPSKNRHGTVISMLTDTPSYENVSPSLIFGCAN
jgi:hypothetical protein